MICLDVVGKGQSTLRNLVRLVVDELDMSSDCDQRRHHFFGDDLGPLDFLTQEFGGR